MVKYHWEYKNWGNQLVLYKEKRAIAEISFFRDDKGFISEGQHIFLDGSEINLEDMYLALSYQKGVEPRDFSCLWDIRRGFFTVEDRDLFSDPAITFFYSRDKEEKKIHIKQMEELTKTGARFATLEKRLRPLDLD